MEPYDVAGVTIAVAQRYSVLLRTNANQTASGSGVFWMRAEIQTDMFTYDEPGQNTDIRGVIRYAISQVKNIPLIFQFHRYSNAPNMTSLPLATDDPGPGNQTLGDMDTSLFVPAIIDSPPNRTR